MTYIEQNNVDEILQNEANNLADKLKSVNTTITSEQRIIRLNDSYSKRMSAYTNIFIGFIFAIGIAIVMKILKNNTPFIPDAVLTIIYILLASSSTIYAMFVLSDIVSRDKNDFDKLDLPPPQAAAKYSGSTRDNTISDGATNPYGYCIGANCCSVNMSTIWDSPSATCKSGCAPGTFKGSTGGCESCPIGFAKSSSDISACTKCGDTQYTETPGSTVCMQCPDGKIANSTGSGCV